MSAINFLGAEKISVGLITEKWQRIYSTEALERAKEVWNMDLVTQMEKQQRIKEELAQMSTDDLITLAVEQAGTADFQHIVNELMERDDLEVPTLPEPSTVFPLLDGDAPALAGDVPSHDGALDGRGWSIPLVEVQQK